MSKTGIGSVVSIVLLSFITGCQQSKTENKKIDLPLIGHHDIAVENTDDHKIGDTLFHKVPSWEYLTQDSVMLKSEEVYDKVLIVDFIFTHCPTICTPMTKKMRDLTDSLNDYKDNLVFLSFSIDPDRDTPSRLRLFRKRFDITAANWYFLTGNEKATHRLGIYGFQIHADADKRAPGGFAHSPNFVLVDPNQHIRGLYDGLDKTDRKQLIIDTKKLINAFK